VTKSRRRTKSGFNIGQFVAEVRREIAKVAWPSRKETMQMTLMIVVMALITGVFFLAVDSLLGYVISHILGMNS
jgi:preprotein translocase subunit SecE